MEALQQRGGARPQGRLELVAEEAEVADPRRLHIGRRDALDAARRVRIAVDQHARAALGHQLVVGDRQRDQRKTHAGEALAHRGALGADVIAGIQAPAPPLQHHAARQVADLAQAPTRKVAEQRGRDRHHHVPEVQHAAPQRRRVVAPVAAAARDRHQAGDAVALRQQAGQLRAEAVADQVDRQRRHFAVERLDRAVEVACPREQVGLEAAQRAARRQRVADAAVVEGQHRIALAGEPARERLVVGLSHAHRAADHDAAAHRRTVGRTEQPSGDRRTVIRHEAHRLHRNSLKCSGTVEVLRTVRFVTRQQAAAPPTVRRARRCRRRPARCRRTSSPCRTSGCGGAARGRRSPSGSRRSRRADGRARSRRPSG